MTHVIAMVISICGPTHCFMYIIAEFAEYEVKPTIYSYTELQVITRFFSSKIGHGAFGAVYKVSAQVIFI